MINYGAAPSVDQIEITVFGPGFGEAIAIHVGANNWFLVDSCIDPDTDLPASHTYLQQIGVQPEHVKAIVASHWHDDHVKGISVLSTIYPDADFLISGVFNNAEALAFLSAYNEEAAPGLARGTNELYKVISQRAKYFPILQRTSVLEINANGRNVKVSALSPVPGAHAQSVAHFAQYLPSKTGGSPINHAPELKPNLEAVALHIDFDGDAALLGSDLEDDSHCGWTAVVTDQWCVARPKGSAYKVAHHGSKTGEHPQIWATLLSKKPVVCVTPFNLGNVKLPTDDDKDRIKNKADEAFISSGATRRPEMDSAIQKRLGDICDKLARVNSGFGVIRLRKKVNDPSWTVELFGNACPL